jgi:flagellar M-ring protein FliF
LSQSLDQIQEFLRGLSFKNKLLMVGGAVTVALTLWLFVGLIDKAKYVTLYSGLRPQDAQSLGSRLAEKNILHALSPDGSSVLVPSENLDAARLATASQGLPRNARLGFELFDTPNWAGSDFSEKVNYQRALEGELERTLQTLNDVEAVRVHLVLPRESLFSEQEHEAKAAVIVKTHGGSLSREAQQAIPQLVASAVDGLRPDNVTVVDADTATPLVPRRGPGGGSFDSDQELAAAAVRAIEPVVGAEHVRASVHVDYDLSTSEETSETYDPKATATLTQQHSEEQGGGGAPAGVPGTASNVPGSGAPNVNIVPALDTQSSKSESTTFAVSKNVHRTMQPAGRVRRLTASVLVDDAVDTKQENGKATTARRKRTPEEMSSIEKLARAAIGVDDKRGDLLAVENLSFQTVPVEAPAAPDRWDRWRRLLQQWGGPLRYVGITLLFLMVYALILRPVKKQALAALKQIPATLARPARGLAADAGTGGELGGVELPAGSEEAKRAGMLKKQVSDKIKIEPAAASRLVQGWIRDDKTN